MTDQIVAASPQFLRDAEIRRGIERLYFGHAHLVRSADEMLAGFDLGRAHHRALYFIARRPGLSVTELLALLAITKQSLGRVLNDLQKRALVVSETGRADRRQRLLTLTPAGAELEQQLFEQLRTRMTEAYSRAGQNAVTGFWAVLEGLIPASERRRLEGLG